MKKLYIHTTLCGLIAAFIFCLHKPSLAQENKDVIYLVDETSVKGDLVDITPQKVKYTNQSKQARNYDTQQITIIFNKSGEYLIFPVKEKENSLKDFVSSANKPTVDLLITLDKQVIPAFIISGNENEAFYQDVQNGNQERTLGKEIIALIIYRSGQHELLVSPSQAAEILSVADKLIKRFRNESYAQKNTIEQKNTDNIDATSVTEPAESAPAQAGSQAQTKESTQVEQVEVETKAEGTKLELKEEEFQRLRLVALQKVKDLSEYIKIISDVQTDREKAKTAIDLACALFADEEARIEVSNVKTGVKNKYKIRDYLSRLSYRTSQYDKIDIEYANINYASEFEKREDGNYYGMIEFMQTFKGISKGKILYGDMTKRNAVVVQKLYDKAEEGKSSKQWDVFLSDIGVVETQKY